MKAIRRKTGRRACHALRPRVALPAALAGLIGLLLMTSTAGAAPAVTLTVHDAYAGGHGNPSGLIAFDDRLFLSVTDGLCGSTGVGRELFVADASGGFGPLANLNDALSGNCDGVTNAFDGLAVATENFLTFEARDNPFDSGETHFEPYVTDGTAAGTLLLKDIAAGDDPSNPTRFRAVLNGTHVAFAAEQLADGFDPEPWITDGTSAGTQRLADLAPGAQGSFPTLFTPLDTSSFVFAATDGTVASQLWASDGATTTLVANIHAFDDEAITEIVTFEGLGAVILAADDGSTGTEPWISDGTPAGTFRLADIRPGSASSGAGSFVQVGALMYFGATDGTSGAELWVTDGTPAGTRMVKDISGTSANGYGRQAEAYQGRLYFMGLDATSGAEVWTSDGTEAGTTLFADLTPGSTGTTPREFTLVGEYLAFSGAGGIWLSDGTVAGTGLVASGFSNPTSLTAMNGTTLGFIATDPLVGRELHVLRIANAPPEIEPIADPTVDEHVQLDLAPVVSDPEGDPFTLTWDGLPSGATTDGGVLSWTPDEAQGPSTYPITVTATQDSDPSLSDIESFTISVNEVNEAPVLDPIVDPTVMTSEAVAFQAVASDPDIPVNTLTFSLGTAPAGATIDPDTGDFWWVACSCATGEHLVEVTVSDGDLTEVATVTITVQNRPPVMDAIVSRVVGEGDLLEVTPVVSDPEGDAFTLSWSGDVPPAAAINGVFSWTPAEADGPGDYVITVTAMQDREPALTAAETFVVSVLEVNQPPVLDPIGPQFGVSGVPVAFTATASDPDLPANELTFSFVPISGDLSSASIDPPTGAFACGCATGEHIVEVTVSDGGAEDSEVVTITVEEAVLTADLQVVVTPDIVQQTMVGDAVAYTASVYNAGPDPVAADLTIELEHRLQAEWGSVPPEAAINGVFFLELGEIAPGITIDVPFEVIYHAFGTQAVVASVSGDHLELVPADNVDADDQVVDLSLDHPAVTIGGLTVDGTDTTDGQPLAVVGVRVPGFLVAGNPPGDVFAPADLSRNAGMPLGWFFSAEATWVTGNLFTPDAAQSLPGHSIPEPDSWLAGSLFVFDVALDGEVIIPALDGSSKVPAGRLLFSDGLGTDALVTQGADTTMSLESAWPNKVTPGGLSVRADGGTADAAVTLCGARFVARLGHGDGGGFQCGSLHATTLAGDVEVELDDGTLLAIPAGASVDVTELIGGGWQVTVAEGGPVTVVGDGEETILGEGETWPLATENQPPTADAGGPYLGAIDTPIALDASDPADEHRCAGNEPLDDHRRCHRAAVPWPEVDPVGEPAPATA